MEIQDLLTTQSIGYPFIFLESIDSTNRIAHDLAEQGMPEGCVICADHQTNGHGRQGRSWFSPQGKNLYVSLILAPQKHTMHISQLSLVVGMAIADTLQRYVDDSKKVGVKWPNDIWINNKKCCGILCEIVNAGDIAKHRLIVGFGININLERAELPPEIKDISTSLFIEIGELTYLSREIILAQILQNIETYYHRWLEHGLADFNEEWESRSVLNGRTITVETPSETFQAEVIGLNPDGSLQVKDKKGHHRSITAGDVHITQY